MSPLIARSLAAVILIDDVRRSETKDFAIEMGPDSLDLAQNDLGSKR